MVDRVVLVRHGETEWSASGQHTSRTDLQLLPVGRERAAGLRSALADWTFSVVLCSPLRRARETAELAGFGARLEVCDELREWDYGEYEGLTTPEIRVRDPDWWLWRDGCPGGEKPDSVAARADRVVRRFLDVSGDVIAFAHGHILRVVAACWLEMDVEAGAHFLFGAGSFGVLAIDRGTRVIDRWNV